MVDEMHQVKVQEQIESAQNQVDVSEQLCIIVSFSRLFGLSLEMVRRAFTESKRSYSFS